MSNICQYLSHLDALPLQVYFFMAVVHYIIAAVLDVNAWLHNIEEETIEKF